MKILRSSALAALRRERQNFLAAALVGALAFTTATLRAQDHAVTPKSSAEPTQKDTSKDNEAELAKKLQNPIAAIINVPFQNNFDFGAGPKGDGFQYKVNIQPVIPFSISENWNLITRTIVPVVYQEKIIPEIHNGKVDYNASQSGLSDTTMSFWFSPKQPTKDWIWGVGPVLYLPTATDDLLGAQKWGAGPTAIALRQEHGWTYGALVNQIWSYTGDSDRDDVNSTFLQPFLVYTFKTHTSVAVNTESTYDWEHTQWTVPIHFIVKQLVKIGGAPMQFELGYRYYAEKPDNGPDWGLRFTVTFLIPKG
jgi:hypothetical protein